MGGEKLRAAIEPLRRKLAVGKSKEIKGSAKPSSSRLGGARNDN